MGKSIVFSFPGKRGEEIPLLYFGAKHYVDKGYEKVYIQHPASGNGLEEVYENAKAILRSYDFSEYEDIVFVGKSMGTVVACKLKAELQIDASLVLFTPLKDTLPYIKSDNRIVLAAAGDNDRFLEWEVLRDHCERENVPYYIESGVGYAMEVKDDLAKNLQVLSNVIGRLK